MNDDKPKVPSCPMCGEKITKFAIWDSDTIGTPNEPQFWGASGVDGNGNPRRAVIHEDGAWVHFRVGNDRGRLAYLALRARKPK